MTDKPTGKVLVMHLVGGIGNQLFCYYAGIVLANAEKRTLALEFADASHGHNMEDIANFNIPCQKVRSRTKGVLKRLSLYKYFDALNYKCKIPKRLKGSLLFPVMEKEINQLGNFSKRKRIHVAGYFQSHEYFELCEKLSLNSNLLLSQSDSSLNELGYNGNRTLGIHVRRGDYLGHKNTFGLLSKKWYRETIELALGSLGNEINTIVFFTNDSEWVSKNLESMIDTVRYKVIVEKDSETTSATEVFKEMTRCKGLIISNSTYSLMAAYHSPATIFAPGTFFKNHETNLLKVTRENWFKVTSLWED